MGLPDQRRCVHEVVKCQQEPITLGSLTVAWTVYEREKERIEPIASRV